MDGLEYSLSKQVIAPICRIPSLRVSFYHIHDGIEYLLYGIACVDALILERVLTPGLFNLHVLDTEIMFSS